MELYTPSGTRGMKEYSSGYKRKNYPRKRSSIIILPKSDIKREPTNLKDTVEQEEEEEVSHEEEFDDPAETTPMVERYFSDDDDSKRVLEERVFGRKIPKVKIREKALRKTSKQWLEKDMQEKANNEKALMAVDMMLDPENPENHSKSMLKLSSLIKSNRRKPRQRQASISSSSSSEEDFDTPRKSYYVNNENANVRSSQRLKAKYSDHSTGTEELTVQSHQESNKEELEFSKTDTNTPSPTRRVTFTNVPMEDITEISRSLSRLSRPNSSDSGRPASQNSRPSSQLSDRPASRLINKSRRHFGYMIDGIEEPEADSPVRTPKLRHMEKAAKAVQESLSPRTKSPFSMQPVKDDEEEPNIPPTLQVRLILMKNIYFNNKKHVVCNTRIPYWVCLP